MAGEEAVVDAILVYKRSGITLIVPSIVESEVLAYTGWEKNQFAEAVRMFREGFTSVPFDRPIAHIAAEIRRTTKLKFPDAAIAATAIFTNTPLLTRNVRDFKKVAGLSVTTILRRQ
jgi:hypothetical protein